jgi:hypothetical protein
MLDFVPNLSTNQDLLIAGIMYLALKSFGVIDLVKSRIVGSSNGNNKSLKQFVTSETDAKENSRVMIQEIHAMGKRQDTRGEQSALEAVKQTELLRSMDSTMQNVLRAIMDRRV